MREEGLGKQLSVTRVVHKLPEVEGLTEHLCLPPEVSPSLQCGGKVLRGIHASAQWAVDQRPFIWAAAVKPLENPPHAPAVWTAWNDAVFYPGAPLPYSGIQIKSPGSEERLEADSSLSSGRSLSAGAALVPKDIDILQQSKVWDPRPHGPEEGPPIRFFFSSPPSRAAPVVASGVETLWQHSLFREGSVVSCTSSPNVSMPTTVGQENPHSARVPTTNLVDVWESSESKDERFLKSSWIEQLIEEGRTQKSAAAVKRKLISGSTNTGKASRITHHDKSPRSDNRSAAAAPKKEISPAARFKDVSMSESLSDNEDPSDDEGEGGPAVSEKRRKRMLSNRASAQRSRQRRQERLDTLEVLVAELRVENAALTRRANHATTTAKKSEEEVKILRDRLGKQEDVPLSDSNASNTSDKSTENSDVAVDNKDGYLWGAEGPVATFFKRNTGSSDYTEGIRPPDDTRYINSRESSRPSKTEGGVDDDDSAQPLKRWNSSSISSSNLDFDFNPDPIQSDAKCHNKSLGSRAMLPESNNNSGAAAVTVKDLYQSAMMSLAHSKSFQSLDPFGIDLEQYNQEMDRKNLDSRSVEDIWLESLSNCLK